MHNFDFVIYEWIVNFVLVVISRKICEPKTETDVWLLYSFLLVLMLITLIGLIKLEVLKGSW